MSDTGQGLLDEDREDEFTTGSDIKNIWGTFYNPLVFILLTQF
jgi:hypothetical protein